MPLLASFRSNRFKPSNDRLGHDSSGMDRRQIPDASVYSDTLESSFGNGSRLLSWHACQCGRRHGGRFKIGETIHIPSVYYEVEEFIHGPNLQLTPKYTLFFFDSNDDTSTRLHQVYKAAKSVTDHAYLITMDEAFQEDPNALLIKPKVESGFSSFVELPVPQLLSALVSEKLHSTMQHPLLKEFKKNRVCENRAFCQLRRRRSLVFRVRSRGLFFHPVFSKFTRFLSKIEKVVSF